MMNLFHRKPVRVLLHAFRSRIGGLRTLLRRVWTRVIVSDHRLYDLYARLKGYREERVRVASRIGYEPNLRTPHTLNEKILWKKLNVRDPLLTRTTDKIAVREYVREKLGGEAESLIIPILHVADTPADLALDDCALPYVVKANHSWNTNLFVQERHADGRFTVSQVNQPASQWTRQQIYAQCNRWLASRHGLREHEWAYQKIPPRLFIEPFIANPDGSRLIEAKVDCFHGTPTYVLAILGGRERSHHTLLDAAGHRLPVQYNDAEEVSDHVLDQVQAVLPRLRDYASRLSADFDYCRVDFYVMAETVHLSEITHYPASGCRRMGLQYDREMGRHWRLAT